MKPVLAGSAMVCLLALGATGRADEAAPTAQVPSPPPPAAPGPPPPAFYMPAPPYATVASTAGYHLHDGLFVRGRFGIGVTSLSATFSGAKTTLSGGGVALGGAIGGVIARNLILYGAFFATDVSNPNMDIAGASTATNVSEVGFGGFGPGVAYYFEPINLYLSGTLGLSAFHASDPAGARLDSSKTGLALELSVGKEWWASHDWGLGLAAELIFASMKDQDMPDVTWSVGAFSVVFSATYN
ncbi:MAG TPA: hypothetical protein VMT03_04570 [Polyangia bacterium]|nr:hypothetical protein [Polyangia bacterium]